jgi:tetratricopeptide (TPR) repeat protein
MPESIRAQFDEALALHQLGRIDDAAARYRLILRTEPGNAEALHMLGVACIQQGDPAEAEKLIGAALDINPASAAAHSNLGNALLLLLRHEDAIRHYEQAVLIQPGFVEAHFNLGRTLQALGRHAAAVPAYEAAIALRPDFAEALDDLGSALQALNRHAEAKAHHERALALAPNNAEALNNLGNTLRALGRHAEALTRFQQALAINPGYAEIHVNAGSALLALDQPAAAMDCFERALAIKPDYAEAQYNFGIALQALKRDREAIARYELALAIRPDYVEAHNNLGNVLMEIGRFEAAMAHYDRALSLRPDFPEAHANNGTALRGLGRMEEARLAFAKAADLAPRTTRTYLDLVDCKRMLADDPYLAVMENLARDAATLDREGRIYLGFALGKAYDDLGRYADAFHCLADANALKRQSIAYDEVAALGEFDRIRTAFSPAVLRRQRTGVASALPIFVVGMPRSGSTLVAQILASHPAVHDGGELTELPQAVANLSAADAPGGFPDAVAGMTDDALCRFAESYLAPLRAMAPAAARIVDKMPSNFRFAGLIHLALPGARIIHTQRDPLDTCFSCYSKLFTAGQPFAYELGELGRYYRAYEALMAHWRHVLPAGALLEVDYEAVVADLEGQARRIVAYCGLEWDDACLAFHQRRGVVRTASASQVRQPIYRTSVGRWRHYRDLLRPMLEALTGKAPG